MVWPAAQQHNKHLTANKHHRLRRFVPAAASLSVRLYISRPRGHLRGILTPSCCVRVAGLQGCTLPNAVMSADRFRLQDSPLGCPQVRGERLQTALKTGVPQGTHRFGPLRGGLLGELQRNHDKGETDAFESCTLIKKTKHLFISRKKKSV